MPSVYIESSVVSYYKARLSPNLEVAARQSLTQRVWPRLLSEFQPYVSALVLQEISKGDPAAASERLKAVEGIRSLDVDSASEAMARALLERHVVPQQFPDDALHIALASKNAIDFLVTWNFSHINNVFTRHRVWSAIEQLGYVAPQICSLEELFGEEASARPDC